MVKWVQNIYDKIKFWQTPDWLKVLLKQIQDTLVSIAFQVGASYIHSIESKIMQVSKENWSSTKKFEVVFNFARKELNLTDIKESALNLLIEALVSNLKARGLID